MVCGNIARSCPESLSLKDTLAALRRGEGIPAGKKVLIVLDQFEQWLHAQKGEEDTELVHALRQCDGGHVQCIVMVRDDFWMAVSRFMRSLEIRLLEGQNSAVVDLFPLRHAEKVLAAFGRAFGDLPEAPEKATKDQRNFLAKAVQDLAEDGKVICVRLALFAEMLKGKPWTPATLEGSRRHGRGRRDVPGGNLQCLDRTARTSLSPESRPCGAQGPAARIGHPDQRAHAVP